VQQQKSGGGNGSSTLGGLPAYVYPVIGAAVGCLLLTVIAVLIICLACRRRSDEKPQPVSLSNLSYEPRPGTGASAVESGVPPIVDPLVSARDASARESAPVATNDYQQLPASALRSSATAAAPSVAAPESVPDRESVAF